ncbi:MAG: GNAT family protein [Actinomycetota bacterium]
MQHEPGAPVVAVDGSTELRAPRDEDAGPLFELIDADRERLAAWLPWVDLTREVEHELAFLQRSRLEASEGRSLALVLWHRNRPVGSMGFGRFEPLDRLGEIGYWIAASHEGRGLVTRAVAALTTYGFQTLGLHRTEILVAVDNLRSRAVPERLGFAQESVLRSRTRSSEGFHDAVLYSVLEDGWDVRADRAAERTE